jgi:restriction endonuclease
MHSAFDLAINQSGRWEVNGEDVDEDIADSLYERSSMEVDEWLAVRCPYCQVPLQSLKFEDADLESEEWRYNRLYVVVCCPRCAYWEFGGNESGSQCMDPGQAVLAKSVAARFSQPLPEGCARELAQHLRRHPALWHEIAPTHLEKLVADIFRANYRHAEVIHVGRPGDRGIDVVFIDDDSTRWLIQVKRRTSSSRKEGFETLQNILGTLALEGERHGIIVTTANGFSHYATRNTVRARNQGYTVELISKQALDRMLDPLIPESPWRVLLSSPAMAGLRQDVIDYFGGNDAQLKLFEGMAA